MSKQSTKLTLPARHREHVKLQRQIEQARQLLDEVDVSLDTWRDNPTITSRWNVGLQVARVLQVLDAVYKSTLCLECKQDD
jgi:hypothetical protein